jgi:hypothetical protein
MSTKKVGRPSNAELIKDGKMIVSSTCKICKSTARNDISQAILKKMPSSQIISNWGHLFDPPLTPTNIHSHKQHISPEAAIKAGRDTALATVPENEYNAVTKQLYKEKFDADFDKMSAADTLYRQRLRNLFHLQSEIERYNKQEEMNNGLLDDTDLAVRRKLISDLEIAYRGFHQDLLKHIQLDADLYVKQVSIQYIESLKKAFLSFTAKFMDVMVKEITDEVTRERVKEQLGDLLDAEITPILSPEKAITAEFEEIKDDVKST